MPKLILNNNNLNIKFFILLGTIKLSIILSLFRNTIAKIIL